MKNIRLIILFLFLLLPAGRASAQWSGSVDAVGGFGAVKSLRGELWEEEGLPKAIFHSLGQGSVRINYKAPTFQWTSLLEGRVEKVSTDNFHLTAFVTDEQDEENGFDLKAIVKMNEGLPIRAQYRTEASWQPADGRRYTLWGRYQLNYTQSSNLTYKAGWKDLTESLSQEAPVTWDHTAEGGLRTVHELGGSRRVLSSAWSFTMNDIRQETTWTTIGVQLGEDGEEEEDVWMGCYKLTPHSRLSTFTGNIHYRDSLLNGPVRLMVNPGVRVTGIKSIHENSGAVLDQEATSVEGLVWRDSTQIREWFHFASQEFQPYLVADFSWKDIRVHTDYALMIYARKLTDSTHFERFKWQSPYLVGNGSIDWQVAPQHRFSMSNHRSVHHPSYLQVCWFDRSGGYMEQLYRGSETLRSTRTRRYKLSYEFNYKRFVASTSLAYSWRNDEIEQTWFKEEIDNRSYKVFTWLNGADSRIQSVSQRVGWRGKVLSANLGVDYNYTVRTWRDSDRIKKSTDWRAMADISARLKKGWTFSTDINYQSAVSTFFAIFKEYCVLNARIQKDFKHFTLYLQGRDLLDKPVESEYISEDEKEFWTESTLHNRRIILLGFSWKF